MYELRYSQIALKQLQKLGKEQRERILNVLERLRIRPESCDIKKLVGMPGFRMRIGEYRVIFEIEHDILIILVLKIGHRRNIYK